MESLWIKRLKPVDNFTQSLLCPELNDIGTGIAEIELDSIMDNPLLRKIPVVKCLPAIWHTGISIRERLELKKQLTFIQHHNGTESRCRQDLCAKLFAGSG